MSAELGMIHGFHATANALAAVSCTRTFSPIVAENYAPLLSAVPWSVWFSIAILLIVRLVWMESSRAAFLLMTAKCP